MNKILIFLFICLLEAFPAMGQGFTFFGEIKTKADYITTDKLGNLYVVTGNQVEQFDASLKKIKTYSAKTSGMIFSVDAMDPFKILLFYKDFRQVRFLDNMLSMKGDIIRLEPLGFTDASLACASFENGLWVYNAFASQVTRLDNNLRKSCESGNITVLTGQEITPAFMVESGNNLYLNDPAYGILVFDHYCTLFKTIPVKKLQSFQVSGNLLYYLDSNKLKTLNLLTFEEKEQGLPLADYTMARLSNKLLYLMTPEKIVAYSIKSQ